MRGRHHVDAAVEEADRLEAEAMAVRLQVAGAAVQHDAHRLRRPGAELAADERAESLVQSADFGATGQRQIW